MKNNIQKLLDKYFEEKTSAAEEQTLREYFAGDDVAEDLEMYRSVFQYVKEEKDMNLGDDFDQKLLQNIISDLTKKYFAGESSTADELDLCAYYSSENVAPELLPFKTWFNYLNQEKNIQVGEGFNERLLGRIQSMQTSSIAKLLEKYFASETTLEEEKSLKAYFQKEDIKHEVSKYSEWFQYLEAELNLTTSDDFTEKIIDRVKGKSKGLKVVSRRPIFLRIAAGFALLLGLVFFLQNGLNSDNQVATSTEIDWAKYEVQSEAEALAEAEEAMRILAKAFGKGSKKAASDLHKVSQATKVLN